MKPFLLIQCVILLFVGANFLGCYPGNTPCKVRAYYTFKNTRSENVLVQLKDSSIAGSPFTAAIRILHDSLEVAPNSIKTDTVDYEWNGVHGCGFTKSTKNSWRISAEFFVSDLILESRFIFPFDTTDEYVSVCVDCMQVFDDTIVIK